MKRVLVVTALVLVISISLVAGTLAMYVIELDDLAEGSVVAKEFILKPGQTNTFVKKVKIAPGETVDWKFSVKNFKNNVVSETAMDLDIKVVLGEAGRKDAIAPLVVTVKNEADTVVGSETGTGTIAIEGEFALQPTGQEKTYTVSIEWPWDGTNDIAYAGASHGTLVTVSVTGTQK